MATYNITTGTGTATLTVSTGARGPSGSAPAGTGFVKVSSGVLTTPAATIPHTDITGLGTLATQNGTFSGTSSGTNTGDETNSSITTALQGTAGDATKIGAEYLPNALSGSGAPLYIAGVPEGMASFLEVSADFGDGTQTVNLQFVEFVPDVVFWSSDGNNVQPLTGEWFYSQWDQLSGVVSVGKFTDNTQVGYFTSNEDVSPEDVVTWTEILAAVSVTSVTELSGGTPSYVGQLYHDTAADVWYRWDGAAWDADAAITNADIAAAIATAAAKNPPIDADELPLTDSAATGALKRLTFANLWAWIKSKIDLGQTWAGAHAFSSATRPTSAGTGLPGATSLITRADGDDRYRYGWIRLEHGSVSASTVGGIVSYPFWMTSGEGAGNGAYYRWSGSGYSHLAWRPGKITYDPGDTYFDERVEFEFIAYFRNVNSTTAYCRFLTNHQQADLYLPPTIKTLGFEVVANQLRALVHDGTTLAFGNAVAVANGTIATVRLDYNPTTRSLMVILNAGLASEVISTTAAGAGPTGVATGTNKGIFWLVTNPAGGTQNVVGAQGFRYRNTVI